MFFLILQRDDFYQNEIKEIFESLDISNEINPKNSKAWLLRVQINARYENKQRKLLDDQERKSQIKEGDE